MHTLQVIVYVFLFFMITRTEYTIFKNSYIFSDLYNTLFHNFLVEQKKTWKILYPSWC